MGGRRGGEKFRKIGREGKKENFMRTKPTPRRVTRGGRGGGRPPPLCQTPLNGCKLSVHFTEKILSSLVYRDLCKFCRI